ncbi:MAG: hypothetical protein LUH11_01610, partial [Candidatus Gastranaerophilales bacterium]|nr:hypothetical protein [Candidatus Gastranaerophilales bacterium]
IDNNAYSQLNCIANAGKGDYYSIDNENEFKLKFKQAFNSNIKTTVSENNTTTTPDVPLNKNDGTIYKNYAYSFNY